MHKYLYLLQLRNAMLRITHQLIVNAQVISNAHCCLFYSRHISIDMCFIQCKEIAVQETANSIPQNKNAQDIL